MSRRPHILIILLPRTVSNFLFYCNTAFLAIPDLIRVLTILSLKHALHLAWVSAIIFSLLRAKRKRRRASFVEQENSQIPRSAAPRISGSSLGKLPRRPHAWPPHEVPGAPLRSNISPSCLDRERPITIQAESWPQEIFVGGGLPRTNGRCTHI